MWTDVLSLVVLVILVCVLVYSHINFCKSQAENKILQAKLARVLEDGQAEILMLRNYILRWTEKDRMTPEAQHEANFVLQEPMNFGKNI
jgi:hypothetical protein